MCSSHYVHDNVFGYLFQQFFHFINKKKSATNMAEFWGDIYTVKYFRNTVFATHHQHYKKVRVFRSCDKILNFSNVVSVYYFSNVYFSWNLSRNVWKQQAIHQATLTTQQHKHTKRPLIMSHNKVEKKKKNLWKFVAFFAWGNSAKHSCVHYDCGKGSSIHSLAHYGWSPYLSVHMNLIFSCVCVWK